MACGTSPSRRSDSTARQAFSFMRGSTSAFCCAMDSAMRARRSSTFSKPSVSLAHSSVTSGSSLVLTAFTSTSKATFAVLPATCARSVDDSAGTSMTNDFVWPFFMPTSSWSNASGNSPDPRP